MIAIAGRFFGDAKCVHGMRNSGFRLLLYMHDRVCFVCARQHSHTNMTLSPPTLIPNLHRCSHLSVPHTPAWGSGYPAAQSLWQRCSSLLLPKVLAIALSNAFADLNGMVRWVAVVEEVMMTVVIFLKWFQNKIILFDR
jgi:hypothetical protein